MSQTQGTRHSPSHTGQWFNCLVCHAAFYRAPSQIRRGSTKTCSKQCLGEYQKGEQNPFWGMTHKMEVRQRISAARKGKGTGNANGKGYVHTPEAREKIRDASKRLWQEHRQKMMESLPRGAAHYLQKSPIERRHRHHFTHRERREWKEARCAFCGTAERLTLDHIVPIFMGGRRERANAQTLCMRCNHWKHFHIEVPMWRYLQAIQAANK